VHASVVEVLTSLSYFKTASCLAVQRVNTIILSELSEISFQSCSLLLLPVSNSKTYSGLVTSSFSSAINVSLPRCFSAYCCATDNFIIEYMKVNPTGISMHHHQMCAGAKLQQDDLGSDPRLTI
jgi:hypothetical protein